MPPRELPRPRDRLAWLAEALDERRNRDLERVRKPAEERSRDLISFASNDYLGLAADPRLVEAARKQAESPPWGAGASPLISGYFQGHAQLERALGEFEGTESALFFNSGYAANLGVIPALARKGDLILSDELNHASIVDGCRLSGARVLIYRHADVGHAAALLAGATDFRRRLIVTDSLFSMDGDFAPLAELAELAEEHSAMLALDEAHATGVFGERGRGLAESLGIEDQVDIRVGTLSKGLGCLGGFVAGPENLTHWLVNTARSYVFSTATPPALAAAAIAALAIVRDEPWRRQDLLASAEGLRGELAAQGWNIGRSTSQIIPVIVGSPGAAMELSRRLVERGYWAPAIRPPSTTPGASRLRISLSYSHDPGMIEGLARALADLRSSFPP